MPSASRRNALPQVDRVRCELVLAVGDRGEEPLQVAVGEELAPLERVVAEHSEVVVVPEQVGELVGLVGGLGKDRLLRVADQTQVVPEVLDALSPFVDRLVAGLGLDVAKAVSPAAIAALDPGADE